MGVALSKYSKFSEFGLEIVALFDIDKDKINKSVENKKIYPLDKIKQIIDETGVNIAILTTPNKVAQDVAQYITKAGIKYIWNFAPSILVCPNDVKVWNENLIGSFLQFCAIENIT